MWQNFCCPKTGFVHKEQEWCWSQELAQGNTFSSFLHFLCLLFPCQEFSLIDRRELAPLHELIEKLGSKDR